MRSASHSDALQVLIVHNVVLRSCADRTADTVPVCFQEIERSIGGFSAIPVRAYTSALKLAVSRKHPGKEQPLYPLLQFIRLHADRAQEYINPFILSKRFTPRWRSLSFRTARQSSNSKLPDMILPPRCIYTPKPKSSAKARSISIG